MSLYEHYGVKSDRIRQAHIIESENSYKVSKLEPKKKFVQKKLFEELFKLR